MFLCCPSRPRPPEQPSSRRASASGSQSLQGVQPTSAPPQSIPQHGPPAEKDSSLADMKELAWGALEMVQTASSLAAEATADVAVPGLSIALSALSEILNKILMMKTTVDGVATLVKHVATLTAKLTAFCKRPRQRQLPEDMLERINGLVATWASIEERARKIKSAGAIKRFFTSDADARKLEELVAEISSSIHDDFLLEQILGIEENVHVIREDVEIIREDVGIVLEDTGAICEDTGAIREDTEAIREDVGVIHEDVEGVIEEVEIVREDMGVVLGDVAVVREDVGVVREDVGIVREDVGIVREDVEVVREDVGVVREDVGGMREELKAMRIRLDVTPSITKYAKNAQYDANVARRSCLEGTRVDILQRLKDWIEIALTYKDLLLADGPGNVFWINGLAGTGKTTVAVSATEWCLEKGILAANFFCSRSDTECSDPKMIFVTIARQLCYFYPPFTEKVDAVLKEKPDIIHAIPEHQFVQLILGPLEELKGTFPRAVIVLDALDECLDKSATSIIVSVIAKYAQRVAQHLLFILTSRPEQQITTLFDKSREESIKNATTLLLHEVPLKMTLDDIRRYADYEFDANVGVFEIQKGWPSTEDRQRIVALSHGLFIFVTTAIAFIMDIDHRDPEGQLDLFFGVQSESSASGVLLYELYAQIISTSYGKASRTLAGKLPKILGAISLAKEALSIVTLASLLGYSEFEVKNALSGLRSVLHIPDDSSQPIRVIHPTFPEFLLRTREQGTSASPVTPDAFYVQPAEQHWLLFSRCPEAMTALKRDMVGIRYPAKFKSEIEGFTELTLEAIPPHVRYASRYWATHLLEGLDDPKGIDVSDRFRSFMHERSLFWFEACLLLDIPATLALEAALSACRTLGGAFAELAPLLTDCHRFMQTNLSMMLTAPLQLYHFALSIAPTNSNVRALYSHELEHSINVRHGAPSRWPPSLDTFVGHGGQKVWTVAFSSDGSCIASGGQDNQVRIRDSASRTELRSFDGHTGGVRSVAWSPDGAYVASGSEAPTVCIWQVSSGACVHMLEGHTDRVCSVAYSADGRRVLSATAYGEVKLWDTADGSCVFALQKTATYTWQAALSPNGDVIARGEGASLVLHDVSSATHEALGFPNKVEASAFSPDGRYVAARTGHAILVWATADKSLVRSIDVPDSTLSSRLAFSHDGKYIACGSGSGAVYVWEVASEDSPHTLNGHTDQVTDVAWSPECLQLASAAEDGTIRLWDGALHSSAPESSAASAHQPAPPGPPRFALIQYGSYATLLHLSSLGIDDFPANPRLPEGALTVTAFTDVVAACDPTLKSDDDLSSSSDRSHNWAYLTGQQRPELGWRPVAISRDGSRLAYLSPTSDKVVDVCDLRSGIVVATLKGHAEDIRSIVFSPDGTRLATGSEDRAVTVWDATTGALICGHAEHQDWVRATAFSSDGRLVASGSDDETVRVFDVAAERVVHVLGPHDKWVIEVMFTVDDDHIVALDHSDQVIIWEVATGSRIYSFSFDTHDWPRSLTFSLITVGIHVHSDAGPRTISLWKPEAEQVTFVVLDGWVYARFRGGVQRLCWLPPEWRTITGSDGGILCLKEAKSDGHPHGRLIVIDMSRILAYIEGLGPDAP